MAEEYDYQICPSCKGEFTLFVERCTECEVDLVSPGVRSDEFPPASELTCIRVAPVPWIEALSQALEEQEVLHRVEPIAPGEVPEGAPVAGEGQGELAGLFVADDGIGPARTIDQAIAAQVNPEQHAEQLAEGEVESCPACGESLAADAAECPECGLAFG